MQGDVVPTPAVGVGTPRAAPAMREPGPGGGVCEEAQRHRGCFTHESIPGCHREVLLFYALPYPQSGANSCTLKIRDGTSLVE